MTHPIYSRHYQDREELPNSVCHGCGMVWPCDVSRLGDALERLELVGSTLARITPEGDPIEPHPRTWHELDDALEQARAVLADRGQADDVA